MSSQNLLAMEGGVPFSPKHKAFADNEGVVARVSVDIESLELGEAAPQARTPPRRAVSNPEAISEEEESQGFRDPPRRSSSNPLPQNSPGDRHREHFASVCWWRHMVHTWVQHFHYCTTYCWHQCPISSHFGYKSKKSPK